MDTKSLIDLATAAGFDARNLSEEQLRELADAIFSYSVEALKRMPEHSRAHLRRAVHPRLSFDMPKG